MKLPDFMLGRLAVGVNDYVQSPLDLFEIQMTNLSDYLKSGGSSGIEWVIGSKCLSDENFFKRCLEGIPSGIAINGVTLNCLMDVSLRYMPIIFDRISRLLPYMANQPMVTVPVFGNLDSYSDQQVASLIDQLHKAQLDVEISVETNIERYQSVSQLADRPVSFVFDIGNLSCASEFWSKSMSYLLSCQISAVHIKDKDADGNNCAYGQGLVHWHDTFNFLARRQDIRCIHERFVKNDWLACDREYISQMSKSGFDKR